ncbi:sugar ABC transporter permease [Jatrophihabitans telluris]|uniref:Sugar ABC transporter permease n=1 Tax=Jatrophihabitans telluris TaxID=2038343 RepID=A0ABY4R273_9ACTN|nr:sugar ABC transporter permease [Jatrophihabitans telluris]UQX89929.1 sugar ABC transporter permease [Jatrophihabitans telluris]
MSATEQALGQADSLSTASSGRQRRRTSGPGIRGREAPAGWLFTAPVIVLIVLFLVVPILMALWVSFSNWTGIGSPFGSSVKFVGLKNYRFLLSEDGLSRQSMMESLRNNFYYVLFVVPIQTALSLLLAVIVNRRRLASRGFFRTAFYFPSVTSSVAIVIVFLFLFGGSGVVNALLAKFGATGPDWLNQTDGLFHIGLAKLGVHNPPGFLIHHALLGQSWWEWLAGPSAAMTVLIVLAVWTTSGTFMLMFLAALQNVSADVEEAAIVDGATGWQRFWKVTLPMLRPTLFLVLTLGLISTWQTFDAQYIIANNNPSIVTPAYLSYQVSFVNRQWGQGAAISFILFFIIIAFAAFQRWVLRDRDEIRDRRRAREQERQTRKRHQGKAAA